MVDHENKNLCLAKDIGIHVYRVCEGKTHQGVMARRVVCLQLALET